MINLIKIESETSSQSSIDSSSDNQLLLIEEGSFSELDRSSSQSSCDCVENCLCHIKQVNTITSDQNFLIELIKKFLIKIFRKNTLKNI